MYHPYRDLRDRLGEPLWHDEHGVPRYVAFHPDHVGVYYRWVALLEIRCQGCDRPYLVADAYDHMQAWRLLKDRGLDIPDDLDLTTVPGAAPTAHGPGWFGYGDAPCWAHDDCPGGATMTTSVSAVVEFWTRDGGAPCVRESPDAPPTRGSDWRRRPEYEFVYAKEEQPA